MYTKPAGQAGMLLFTNLVREQGVWGRGVAQWAGFSRISCGAMETCRGGESETQIDS